MKSILPASTRLRRRIGFVQLVVLGALVSGCAEESLDGRDAPVSAEVVQEVLLMENPAQSARALMAILGRLDATNVEAVARAYRANAAVIPDWQVVPFLHAFTDLDPVAALAETQRWKFPFRRRFGAREVAYRWAWRGNALAAREHILTIEAPLVRREALGGFVQGWSRSDLSGVNDFLAGYGDIDLRDDLALEVARSVQYVSGFAGLRAWADALPPERDDVVGRKFKRTVYHAALRYGANVDPAAAAEWMDQHRSTFHGRNTLAIVATEWIEHDPAASIAWLRSQPASKDRTWAMSRALHRWLDRDFAGAEAWLLSQPVASLGSDTMASYSGRLLKRKRFADSAHWAERIPDALVRRRSLAAVGGVWLSERPEGARTWLESAAVDARLRQEIEARARKRARGASGSPRAPKGGTPSNHPPR